MAELALPRPAVALPFARNCAALEAYVNHVGRSMNPPVQVSELGDWYETDNYIACESGRVVRYLPSNTEVCQLYGENRWPYTAVDYVPSSRRLKVRTSTCTVLPPQPLPWKAINPPRQPSQWLTAPASPTTVTGLGVVFLASGLLALGMLVLRQRRTAPAAGRAGRAQVMLHEEVMFLLDPPHETPATKPTQSTERGQ